MLSLTPKVHPITQRFLIDHALLDMLVRGLGSPLNLVFPQVLPENIRAFQQVFEDEGVRGRVFATHKPNKSLALMREIAQQPVSIDVSSYGELVHALEAGFDGGRIGATGIKNEAFLRLALQHGVTIAIDNLEELKLLTQLASHDPERKAKVLLRLCEFSSSHTSIRWKDSRFGLRASGIDEAFQWIGEHRQLELLGIAFHLSEATQTEKIIAIESALAAIVRANEYGLSPRVLNIGGGFRVSYISSSDEWEAYVSALKSSVMGSGPNLSWDHSGLGFHHECGVLRGGSSFASSYLPVSGAGELKEVLRARLPGFHHASVAQVVNEHLLELWIEPGRSLLDQSGMTVASVLYTKESAHGEHLIVLEMNRSNLNTFDLSVLMDPIVIHKQAGSRRALSEGEGVFFVGNLCSSDFLTRHKTMLTHLPQAGDLVVFPNTAGYRMDFSESQTHFQPVAKKVAIHERHDGEFAWYLDHLSPSGV